MNPSLPHRRTIQSFARSVRLKDYLAIIVRRLPLIIIALLSVVLSTVFYVVQIEDIYESYSTIVIEQYNPLISQALKKAPRSLSFYQGILNSLSLIHI